MSAGSPQQRQLADTTPRQAGQHRRPQSAPHTPHTPPRAASRHRRPGSARQLALGSPAASVTATAATPTVWQGRSVIRWDGLSVKDGALLAGAAPSASPAKQLAAAAAEAAAAAAMSSSASPATRSVTAPPLWRWSGDALANVVGAASRYKGPARMERGLRATPSMIDEGAEAADDDDVPLWSEQAEKQVRSWLRARRMRPSHAQKQLAPALHAMDFSEDDWIATLDAMGTDGVHALIATVKEQQEEAAAEAATAVPEAEVELELAIELPSDPEELAALQAQIREDMAAALGVDVAQLGEIELTSAVE